MTSRSQYMLSSRNLCDVCLKVPWYDLPSEELPGYPHQTSRQALETSAKTCRACKLVLGAARSNYRFSRNTRYSKGFWRELSSLKYVEDFAVRDVTISKELGSCAPTTDTTSGRQNRGAVVIAPTGCIDASGEHLLEEETSTEDTIWLESMEILSSTAPIKVWLYGNWWQDIQQSDGDDRSDMRLVGIGARFGRSALIWDAINNTTDHVHLCGSAIGVCTNDGLLTLHLQRFRI